jgi:hypothetical protein
VEEKVVAFSIKSKHFPAVLPADFYTDGTYTIYMNYPECCEHMKVRETNLWVSSIDKKGALQMYAFDLSIMEVKPFCNTYLEAYREYMVHYVFEVMLIEER